MTDITVNQDKLEAWIKEKKALENDPKHAEDLNWNNGFRRALPFCRDIFGGV